MQFAINHIQHIGIPVTDLQRSQTFCEKLGFEMAMPSSSDHNGNKGYLATMQKGAMIMEIYQMPENELNEIRNRKDGQIDHVAFDVDDIDEALMELKNASFSIIENAPVFLPFWKNGCRYFNITAPMEKG